MTAHRRALWIASVLLSACGTAAATGSSGAALASADASLRAADAAPADGTAAADTVTAGDASAGPAPAAADVDAGGVDGGARSGDSTASGATTDTGEASDASAADTASGCAKGQFRASVGAPCVPATCEAMLAAVQQAIAEAATGARTCATDSDCTVIPTTTACQGTCGEAIAKAQAAQLEAAVNWVDIHICKAQQFADKCGYMTPKCMAPKPTCVQGQCAYLPP